MTNNHKNVDEEKRSMPAWKLLAVCYFAILGSIVPILILMTIFSHIDFIDALIKAAIGVAIVVVFLMLFAQFVIEKWWNRLEWSAQEKLRNFGIGTILVAFFILGPTGAFGGSTWRGTGTVNLFPFDSASKNYRVDAEMTVHTKMLWQKEYAIDSVEWPNGGLSNFSDCKLTNKNKSCKDEEGREWTIEVVSAPESDVPDNY